MAGFLSALSHKVAFGVRGGWGREAGGGFGGGWRLTSLVEGSRGWHPGGDTRICWGTRGAGGKAVDLGAHLGQGCRGFVLGSPPAKGLCCPCDSCTVTPSASLCPELPPKYVFFPGDFCY